MLPWTLAQQRCRQLTTQLTWMVNATALLPWSLWTVYTRHKVLKTATPQVDSAVELHIAQMFFKHPMLYICYTFFAKDIFMTDKDTYMLYSENQTL